MTTVTLNHALAADPAIAVLRTRLASDTAEELAFWDLMCHTCD